MALDINVKFNIDEELKKTVKSINDSTKVIANSMKTLADSVEKGMKGATSGIDSMITNLNKLGQGNAIKSIVQQYDALNLAQKNNTISTSEYSKQISNLFIELQKVAGGLDNVKNKQKGVGGLSGLETQKVKSGGFSNKGSLENVDVPKLQQIIMLSEQERKNATLTKEERLKINDQLELAKQKMLELNMSSSQIAAREKKISDEKFAKEEAERIKKQKEEEKIAKEKEAALARERKEKEKLSKEEQKEYDRLAKEKEKALARELKEREKLSREQQRAYEKASKLAEKQMEKEAAITRQKQKQAEAEAIAARRSNFGTAFSFAKKMDEGTIPQTAAKIKEMQIAREALVKTDANYKQNLAKVNTEINRLTKEQNAATKSGLQLAGQTDKTSNSLRQMGQMVGAYFSVYAVKNFVTELANVTGEFDLQRKSLGALLQNKEQADAIFEKIKESSLKSPFSVMDLTNYTKQLAAYRIEGDKLFETMTMLADVSSGLGVDMGRIILAFGQVKAASVLRGQELRQFTEAGIPLVQLLADKFGELEDRTVSTGEVFDKISNRLVPFQMIEGIFKDMTKSGGMFYEMQKIQAETIKGRIVNLTDAYQLMLDKIGTSNTGVIKGFISLLESMLRNFEGILTVIVPLISALITYKSLIIAITSVQSLMYGTQKAGILSMAKAIIAGKAYNTQLTAQLVLEKKLTEAQAARLLMSSKVALIIGALVGVGVAAYKTYQYLNKLNIELEKIENKGQADYSNLVSTFTRLQKIYSDSTKSLEEQNAAYEELKRTFKDILPSKLLEIDYLKQTALGYDAVKTAIYNKIKAQTQEAKLTAVQQEYGEKLAKDEKRLIENIVKKQNVSEIDIIPFLDILREISSKNIGNRRKMGEEAIAAYNKYFKADITEFVGGFAEFLYDYETYSYRINEITKNTLRNVSNSYTKFEPEFRQIGYKLQESLKKDFSIVSSPKDFAEFKKSYDSIINYYNAKIEQVSKMPNSEQKSLFLIRLEQERNNFVSETEQQFRMLQEIANVATEFNLPTSTLMKYLKPKDEGSTEWLDKQKTTIEQRKKQIETYLNTEESLRDGSIKNIDLFKRETEALEKLAYKYGLREKESGGGSSGESKLIKALKEEIKLIETLQKEYDKLVKAGSGAAEARQKVNTEYAKNIKEVQKSLSKVGINVDFGTLITSDKNVLLDLYKKQMEQFKGNADVQKLLTESFGKLGVEIQILNLNEIELQLKNEFERIKNNRSISLELNDAPESTRDILKLLYGISEKDILSEMTVFQQRLNDYIRGGILKIGAGGGVIEDFTKLTKDEFLKILEPFKDGDQYNQIAKTLIDAFDYLKGEQIKYIDNIGKSYKELLNKYADFNVRIIEVENKKNQELKALEENFKNSTIKDLKTYNNLKLAIEKRAAKDIAEIKYQELKESEEYINMFDRIGILGEENMVQSYGKVRDGIVEAFSKGTISLRIFKSSLAELDKQFQDFYMQQGKFVSYLQGGFDGLFKNISETSYNLQAIATEIEKIGKVSGELEFRNKLGIDNINYLEKNGQDVSKMFADGKGDTAAIAKNLGAGAKGMSQFAAKGANAAAIVQLIFTNIYGAIKGINELRDAFDRLNRSQGDYVNEYTTQNDKFFTALGNFNEKTMQGFNQAKSGDLLGGIMTAIQSYVDIFSDYNESSDKQIQERIDDTTDAIKRQQRALDKLSDTLDEYLGNDWIKQQKLIADGYLQLAANIQKNIDDEKSKKNPDEDVLAQYEEDLYDAEKAAKDAVKAMVEEMTGADIKSAAEDFANIWIESFLAGEDAMKNMEERFGEMIKNMIMKTIVSKVIEARLRKFYEQLEADIKSDDELTLPEILNLSQIGLDAIRAAGKDLEGFEAFFQQISNMLGLGSTSDMDTLQKGISNITEESAQIIAAYLNSLKYEVFKQTGFLSQMSVNSALTMNMTSDILQQSRLTYQVIMAIKSWTDSISTTSPNAGLGIRVYGI